MTKKQVVAFLAIVVPLFLLIDVWLALDKDKGNTYSEILRDTGNRHPWFRVLFIFAWGVLAGHWWW